MASGLCLSRSFSFERDRDRRSPTRSTSLSPFPRREGGAGGLGFPPKHSKDRRLIPCPRPKPSLILTSLKATI